MHACTLVTGMQLERIYYACMCALKAVTMLIGYSNAFLAVYLN